MIPPKQCEDRVMLRFLFSNQPTVSHTVWNMSDNLDKAIIIPRINDSVGNNIECLVVPQNGNFFTLPVTYYLYVELKAAQALAE